MNLLILSEEAIEKLKIIQEVIHKCLDCTWSKWWVQNHKYIQGEGKENTEEHKMKGMLSALAETKKKNFVEQKQVYFKYGLDEFKFLCLENNMVGLIEDKIQFGPS